MKPAIFYTLYFKLAFGLAIILLIIGASYSLFSYFMIQQISQSSQQLINHDLALNLVNDKKIVHHGKIDKKALKDTFMQYMTINPSIEIYYLDLNGKILAYSAEPGKVKRNSVDLAPINNRLKNNFSSNKPQYSFGDDPRSHDQKKSFSVTPIPDKNRPEGYLYVVLQSEELSRALNQQAQNTIIYLGGTVLGGSLIFGLLLGLFLFYRISLRLNALQSSVSSFIKDDYNNPALLLESTCDSTHNDEINELQKKFSDMAEHIQQQWSALKQQDNLRREMVANISHDLRTPLASIQGYLETITVKYESLSDQEITSYIKIASKQATGLQKLIDGLLELAKLDACEQPPIMENFSLLELIYDVITKFQIKAQHKNISFNIESISNNPQVVADLRLIERVLDNLISNAIYYSHNNSHIDIMIDSPRNNRLTIKICDQGCGIDKTQQALVFERFHQAHTPERRDGHAGLGLCIVKKIMELHQQTIWIESQPDQGAEFNFTLATV